MRFYQLILVLGALPLLSIAQQVSPPTINVCDGDQSICLTGPIHNQIGLSYDVLLSQLGFGNRHNGALELSLNYLFREYKGCVVCPH